MPAESHTYIVNEGAEKKETVEGSIRLRDV